MPGTTKNRRRDTCRCRGNASEVRSIIASNLRLLCKRASLASFDAHRCHHAGGLMLQDVAMEHPVAGIVGDEGDVDAFFWCGEHRILPLLEPRRHPVPRYHSKRVAMQVDGMMEGGVVLQGEGVGAAAFQEQYGRMRMLGRGHAVDRPNVVAVTHH